MRTGVRPCKRKCISSTKSFVKINFNFKSKCPSMRANKMIGASWLAWRRTNYLEINKRDNFGIQRVVSLELSSRISCESLQRWTTNAFAAKRILKKLGFRKVKTRRIHFELSSLTPSRKEFSSLLNCFLQFLNICSVDLSSANQNIFFQISLNTVSVQKICSLISLYRTGKPIRENLITQECANTLLWGYSVGSVTLLSTPSFMQLMKSSGVDSDHYLSRSRDDDS